MGQIVQSGCGLPPATFFEMLASCARVDTVTGDIYLNTLCYTPSCSHDAAIECGNVPSDLEQFCASNLFALDNCGHLALKIGNCTRELE